MSTEGSIYLSAIGRGPPGKATLVSPFGTIITTTPAYVWNAVSTATWYQLYVSDSGGAAKIQSWLTAEQAGCGDGKKTCTAKPATALALGAAKWWIQTWNQYGEGPWSSPLTFTVAQGGIPGKATLMSPSGYAISPSPTYTWNAVPDATWYQLWVADGSSGYAKIRDWFTPAVAAPEVLQ